MRAETKGKHEMGKRFALLIGVAALGVMALGAQTAAAATYNTKLTINHEGGPIDPRPGECGGHGSGRCVLWDGGVNSKVRECEDGRRVILFRKRQVANRQLGTTLSDFRPDYGFGNWGLNAPVRGRVYAKVMPKVGDGFVCRADRSRTILNGQTGGW
jgi:hypothetical protein